MRHVDGLLHCLDLIGAIDADGDVGHHVAPPCGRLLRPRSRGPAHSHASPRWLPEQLRLTNAVPVKCPHAPLGVSTAVSGRRGEFRESDARARLRRRGAAKQPDADDILVGRGSTGGLPSRRARGRAEKRDEGARVRVGDPPGVVRPRHQRAQGAAGALDPVDDGLRYRSDSPLAKARLGIGGQVRPIPRAPRADEGKSAAEGPSACGSSRRRRALPRDSAGAPRASRRAPALAPRARGRRSASGRSCRLPEQRWRMGEQSDAGV
jgi:hypothetical protein